jgi:hypothetical protein
MGDTMKRLSLEEMDNMPNRKSERGVYAASSPKVKVGMDFRTFLAGGWRSGLKPALHYPFVRDFICSRRPVLRSNTAEVGRQSALIPRLIKYARTDVRGYEAVTGIVPRAVPTSPLSHYRSR